MVQKRPKGQNWPITTAWRQWVLDEMERQHLSLSELARRAGTTRQSIGNAIDPGTLQTRLMPAINAALGGAPPEVSSPERSQTLRDEIVDGIDDLSEDDQRLVAALIESLIRKG